MWKYLLLTLISTSVFASPLSELTKIGSGEMKYLFWTLYRAEYYQASPHALTQDGQTAVNPRALKIQYFKSIQRDALIEATVEQWQRLGVPSEEVSTWVEPLRQIWPSVKPDNTLTLLITTSGTSIFYFNGKEIGEIQDTRFGDSFLSIWLSEQTSEPELRELLLGGSK